MVRFDSLRSRILSILFILSKSHSSATSLKPSLGRAGSDPEQPATAGRKALERPVVGGVRASALCARSSR
jgi:hypothetical protein